MLDDADLERVLRAGAQQFAETVRPPAAPSVRRRADRRRRSRSIAAGALAVGVLAGAAVGYRLAIVPGPAKLAHHRLNAIRLDAPSRYVRGVPNSVTFAIPASSSGLVRTVRLELGRPGYPAVRALAVLRHDPASGQWRRLALSPNAGGWSARYLVPVSEADLVQSLVVLPAIPRPGTSGEAGRLRVTVLAGSKVLGSQRGPKTSIGALTGFWQPATGPGISVSGGQIKQLSYTVRNPEGVAYDVALHVSASLCPSPGCHAKPPGASVEWLDRKVGVWEELSPAAWAAPDGQLLEIARLVPRSTMTIRFQVTDLGGPSTTGALGMDLETVPGSFPGGDGSYPIVASSSGSASITTG